MLIACLFYLAYVFSAFKARPDWGLAVSNLLYPHGVAFTKGYLKDYLIIGMGVLGTTITPWGQFFISSFALDKKIEAGKILYSQLETYWGAFLTDFFSFFMIVATAAILFVNNIPLESGEQAALAIKPFAGELAGTLFAVGILNAGFMGIVSFLYPRLMRSRNSLACPAASTRPISRAGRFTFSFSGKCSSRQSPLCSQGSRSFN